MSDIPTVTSVTSADDVTWGVEFDDGVTLHCAKAPPRNDAHVDTIIASHGHSGIDPVHTERMKAMITAVRAHENQGN